MNAESKTETRQPTVLTIPEAATEVRLSVDSIKSAIRSNDLSAKYYGTKALVKFEELMRWFDNLPDEKQGRAV